MDSSVNSRPRRDLFPFFLLLVCFAVRLTLALLPRAAGSAEDVINLTLSKNIWLRGSLAIYALPASAPHLLYPLLISPVWAIGDAVLRMTVLAVINAVLISSALIPGWLLARRYLKKRGSIRIALLMLALSPSLGFSMTYMAENLYLPLLLWGILFLSQAISGKARNILQALLLGVWSFLLCITHVSGFAFLASAGIVMVTKLRIHPANRKQILSSLSAFAAGAFFPLLLYCLMIPAEASAALFPRVLPASPSGVVFLLYCMATALMYFCISGLFLPVLFPMTRFRSMTGKQLLLLRFSMLYVLLAALWMILLCVYPSGEATVDVRIPLRCLSAALYPFILLFLQGAEEMPEETNARLSFRNSAFWLTLIFIALLFLPWPSGIPEGTDSPVLSVLARMPGTWVRIAIAAGIAICLLLQTAGKNRKAFLCLVSALLVWEASNSIVFTLERRKAEALPNAPSTAETAALDRFLDSKAGNILSVRHGAEDPAGRMMDTYTDDDYHVISSADLMTLSNASSRKGNVILAETDLPAADLLHSEAQPIHRLDYLVVSDPELPLSELFHVDITPPDISSWKIFRNYDPTTVHLQDPTRYQIGDLLTFSGDHPTFVQYLTSGFADAEPAFTWTDGNIASISLAPSWSAPEDLVAELAFAGANGPQACRILANGVAVWEGELETGAVLTFPVPAYVFTDYSLYGDVVFEIELPDAAEPGNGDPRKLGIAMQYFLLRRP